MFCHFKDAAEVQVTSEITFLEVTCGGFHKGFTQLYEHWLKCVLQMNSISNAAAFKRFLMPPDSRSGPYTDRILQETGHKMHIQEGDLPHQTERLEIKQAEAHIFLLHIKQYFLHFPSVFVHENNNIVLLK